MSNQELASAFSAQENDLVAYSRWRGIPLPTIDAIQTTLEKDGPRRLVNGIFQRAADTVSSPKNAEMGIEKATHELTRKSLELTVREDALSHTTMGDFYWDACMQAEPRFVHSLTEHEVPEAIQEPRESASYASALVLFDTKDEPFAYQKDNGIDTALAWRDAHYKTENGEVWIPAGAIFMATWNGDYPSPATTFNEEGIIAVHPKVAPDFAYLRRLSTWSTADEIREAGAELGVDAMPYADESIDGVMGCTLEGFGERVRGLLDDAKHVTETDITKRAH